jgi:hypothetical protein
MLTIWVVAWFAWNMLPPPIAPPMQQMAKNTARNLPSFLSPSSASPSRR